MKKAELWDNILNILKQHNASEDLTKELGQLLATKERVVHVKINEPLKDENGNITHIFCVWHKEYEPIEEFAKSTKSATGVHYECKAASAEWQEYAKRIKHKEAELSKILDSILDGSLSQIEAKAKSDTLKVEIEAMKTARINKVNVVDFDAANTVTPKPKKSKKVAE